MESLEINVAKLQENVKTIKDDVSDLKGEFKSFRTYIKQEFENFGKELREGYVTREQLAPVKDRVSKIETVLNKGMWIILGAIIISVLSIALPRVI